MFTNTQRRFIKETLIHIYRKQPEMTKLPVWFLPFDDKPDESMIEAVTALQDFVPLPWPDENCIILTENPWIEALCSDKAYSMLAFIHLKRNDDQYVDEMMNQCQKHAYPDFFHGGHDIHTLTTTYYREQRNILFRSGQVFLHHTDERIPMATAEQSCRDRAKEIAGVLREEFGVSDPFIEQKCYKRIMRNLEVGGKTLIGTPKILKNCWMARTLDDPEKEQFGLACNMLESLANIMVPCAYAVKSKFTEGFGTSSLRRLTKDKPIFSFISYDRLYKEIGDNGEYTGPRSPHFRRGHIRHFWQEAGINRHSLPADALARLCIVRDRRVRRTYIPPTWIGQKNFAGDGVEYEIVTKEIPLAAL